MSVMVQNVIIGALFLAALIYVIRRNFNNKEDDCGCNKCDIPQIKKKKPL
jgi:hypothetical protein